MDSGSEFQVRAATLEDLSTLIGFIVQEASEAEGRAPGTEKISKGIRMALEDPQLARYWVLEHVPSRRLVGSVSSLTEWSDWNGANYWWVQSMFVLPEYRGRGLVNLLMSRVEAEGRAQGAIELRLLVHGENKAAIRAYEKTRFLEGPYRMMAKSLRE
jgi:ribosomal protein S18 acetylase RimI-like enzyme